MPRRARPPQPPDPRVRAARWKGAAVGALLGLGLWGVMMTPPDAPVLHCGDCRAVRVTIPIVRGFPSYELIEAARRGEVVLGGCMVEPGAPVRACGTCRTPIGAWDPWNLLVAMVP